VLYKYNGQYDAKREEHGRDTRAPKGEGAAKNMRFCETNPFYSCDIFGVSPLFTETYAVCNGVCKWFRSGKTGSI
jgi:hypothetical protein